MQRRLSRAYSHGSASSTHQPLGERYRSLGHPFLDDYSESPFVDLWSYSRRSSLIEEGNSSVRKGDVEVFDLEKELTEAQTPGGSLKDDETSPIQPEAEHVENLNPEVDEKLKKFQSHQWVLWSSTMSVQQLLKDPKTSFSFRIIFLTETENYKIQDLAELVQHFGIPDVFWDEEGNGSVGHRSNAPSTFGKTSDTWLRIRLKSYIGDSSTQAFQQSSFLLKQYPNFTLLLCLNVPLPFRARLLESLQTTHHHTTQESQEYFNELIRDPFMILHPIIMKWYTWNSGLFWSLRNSLVALEAAKRDARFADRVDYKYMHLLSKDLLQAIEMEEVAVDSIAQLQKIRQRGVKVGMSEEAEELGERNGEWLDYQFGRFQNQLRRTRQVLERMKGEIGLTYQLQQEQNAQIAQRSSDSVATISAITLIFLPPTAIATIFAMPFIHFTESGQMKIYPEFRFYWAITIPITIVLVLLWYLWWHPGILHSPHLPSQKPTLESEATKTQTQRRVSVSRQKEEEGVVELVTRPSSPHHWELGTEWPDPVDGWKLKGPGQSWYGVGPRKRSSVGTQ